MPSSRLPRLSSWRWRRSDRTSRYPGEAHVEYGCNDRPRLLSPGRGSSGWSHRWLCYPTAGWPEVVGVLEFYGAEQPMPESALLETMAQIGTQLGRAIERERAVEQAQHQQAALFQREKLAAMGALLANVAHELNNPLAVICCRRTPARRHE